MNAITIKDDDTFCVANINSSGQLEYTTYKAADGGVIDMPYDNPDSMTALLADTVGMTEYEDAYLVPIQDTN